jgi:HSP20 family protein
MMTSFSHFDRSFDLLGELRRHVRALESDAATTATFAPQLDVWDAGETLVVEVDVPGVKEEDIDVTIHDGVLTLSGERKVAAPEGHTAKRRERAGYRFSRRLALPTKVDVEKTTASVANGVLTITLTKASDAKPRHIAVKAKA